MPANCDWTVIEGFRSDAEYEQLLSKLVELVRSGLAKEVRVRKPYSGIDWDEHWYRCNESKETWRLVAPDPPFDGVFKPVES